MSREFSVVIERDEDGYYVASVPALPGCYTQARSLDDLMGRVQEAIALCLEDEPRSRLQFVPAFLGRQHETVLLNSPCSGALLRQ
jgi:predicted RNase H-like HicB family nuclease